MRTELIIEGANCPQCLNETLDRLRGLPGVRSAEASSVHGCLVVDHADLDVEDLVEAMQHHLHGVSRAGTEIVMTEIGPRVRSLGCAH